MGRILSGALTSITLLLAGCGGQPSSESVRMNPFDQDNILNPSQIDWDHLEILFPVMGKTHFSNDWQEPRDGGKRRHEGNDLLAKKMTPVIAVADGRVAWVRAKKGGECCYLAIEHEAQGLHWESWYIHLNNDTPGTDDGKAVGIAKGIEKGVHVRAGQLIGWVGDSGNAENTTSHLHFELHDEYSRPLNPYRFLMRAVHLDHVLYGATAGPTAANYAFISAREQDDFENLSGANPYLNDFTTDACTAYPNGTRKDPHLWEHCCIEHDMYFWTGGSRLLANQADLRLKECVEETGQKTQARLIYDGVRLQRRLPHVIRKMRWGNGWIEPRREWRPLDLEDYAHIVKKLDEVDQPKSIKDSYLTHLLQFIQGEPENLK